MTEREVMADLVRFVGVLTYGKERWFKQNGCWYDRLFGDYIQNEVLFERITKAINDETEDRPTGKWTIEEAESIYGKKYILTCPECGESVSVTEQALPHEKFCRNCGSYNGE